MFSTTSHAKCDVGSMWLLFGEKGLFDTHFYKIVYIMI